MPARNEAEAIFEGYLRSRGVTWEYEAAAGGSHPDFWIDVPSRAVCEVRHATLHSGQHELWNMTSLGVRAPRLAADAGTIRPGHEPVFGWVVRLVKSFYTANQSSPPFGPRVWNGGDFSLEVEVTPRLRVFIDYQNAYMRARDAFGDASTEKDFTFGQIFPRRLGVRLRQMAENGGKVRTLDQVRVWVEFAAWRPDVGYASHLRIDGRKTWCHHLRRSDFEMVADSNDYTKPVPGPPPTT